jgi:hypothetical protein
MTIAKYDIHAIQLGVKSVLDVDISCRLTLGSAVPFAAVLQTHAESPAAPIISN